MIKRLIFPLLSSIMLAMPWLGGGSLWILIALVPLLLLEKQTRNETSNDQAKNKGKKHKKRFVIYAALCFFLWNLYTVWWIANAAAIGLIAALIIGTALPTAVFAVYRYMASRAPKSLVYTTLVTLWIAAEVLYITGELSFPWLTLGNAFARGVEFAQWYEYTGVLGGSLWVLIVNILVFEAINTVPEGKSFMKRLGARPARTVVAAVFIIAPIAASLTMYYGYKEPQGKSVNVEVIQPNIEPWTEKFAMGQDEQTGILLSLMMQSPKEVDYIIAPETAIDDQLWEGEMEISQSIQEMTALLKTRYPNAVIVTGASTLKRYNHTNRSKTARTDSNIDFWYDYYNSGLQIDSAGRIDVHHKSILVAGAEKIPFYSILKNVEFLSVELGGISGQLGVDSVRTIFTSPQGVRASSAICYESIYGDYFREFILRGAQVMFVITNDGWWGDTPGYKQHFSYSRLRAIETRRSIARSANTGISGFINGRGDVIESMGWDVRGALNKDLKLNDEITFFVRYGDYIGRLSCYIAALCLLYFGAYRIRKKSHIA